MTPARPFFRTLPVIAAAAVLGLATWAFSQLQAPETKAALARAQIPAAAGPMEESRPAQRSGDPQTVPGSNAADSAQTETEVSEETEPASQTAPQTTEATETIVEKSPAPVAAPVPDMTAFVEALRAAERANDNLAARLAQMEASAALQRERDQAFIRDMIKGVLILAGTMASVGMLALVAIVYLQLRSTKQQAITFAAQLQALTSHIALPPPSGTPAISNHGGSGHFASTAQKIEERLSDLESMTSGLPEPRAHAQAVEVPAHEPRRAAVEFSASRVASTGGTARGERAADLIAKADSLLMQQQPEVALAYIDQAISGSPRNPEAHLKRGNALERLDRLGEALTAYDRAIESEPTLAVAFLAKAGVLNKLQRYGEALKCYEAALSQQGGGQSASESPAA